MEKRYRNFATVVYPESAPINWIEILEEMIIPVLISPLHDKDYNSDGSLKKAHYHVMICFDGVKSVEQVRVLFEKINGVGCEIVNSLRSYARYLVHMDNPDKAQYNHQNVIAFGGIDYQRIVMQPTDKYLIISEILDYCVDNSIYSYASLLMYAKNNKKEWFETLCGTASIVIIQFLKSIHWTDNLNKEKWR